MVYILRPNIEDLEKAMKQRALQGKNNGPESFFIFVPRRTIECDELLEKNGLNTPDRVFYVALDLVSIETDLMSLELPNNFSNHILRDDDTYKVYVQSSVKRIESVFG